MEQPGAETNEAAKVSVNTATLPPDMQLLKQGAEAKVYTCSFLGRPTIVKERFKKGYRHPALDRSLTAQRTKGEVRCMMRCRAHGEGLHSANIFSNRILLIIFLRRI